jgi:hypothetical protein
MVVVSRSSKQLEGSSLPEQSKTEWKRGAAGYGTPVPQSRVSLSDSEARSRVLPLGVRAEFLLVSPDSQLTFQRSVRSLELSARIASGGKKSCAHLRVPRLL